MLNVGDLVCADKDCHTLDCMCFFCFPPDNKDLIGIVTTVWIEEDDRQASIIEFPICEAVFREESYKLLNIISSF